VAHNVETVPRLSRALRDRRATYATSLGALRAAKRERRDVLTKSSLMLGLGEDDDEVIDALIDLRAADVDIVTLGQYLRPSRRHARVARWVDPARFDDFAADARSLGFRAVASGPLVRSSYRAAELAALAGADRYRARPHRVER
jgi:lipoic acid synthetase